MHRTNTFDDYIAQYGEALEEPDQVENFYFTCTEEALNNGPIFKRQANGTITGIRAYENHGELFEELNRVIPHVRLVTLGVSLFQGKLPNKLPGAEKLIRIPFKHIILDEREQLRKSVFILRDIFSARTYAGQERPIMNAHVILADNNSAPMLRRAGYEEIKLNDEPGYLNIDSRFGKWELFCPQNFVPPLITVVHVHHIGDVDFRPALCANLEYYTRNIQNMSFFGIYHTREEIGAESDYVNSEYSDDVSSVFSYDNHDDFIVGAYPNYYLADLI